MPKHLSTYLWMAFLVAAVGCSEAPSEEQVTATPAEQESCEECEEEGPVCDDTSSLELFERRIVPLLRDDRASSCNRCHLSGLDINAFVRDSPCEAMACLVDAELVDFDDPEASVLLSWISRGSAESEGLVTDTLVSEEYQGFLDWITYSAECHSAVCGEAAGVCPDVGPAEEPCTLNDPREACALDPCASGHTGPGCDRGAQERCLDDPFAEGCSPEELDPCSQAGLAQSFIFNVLPWRGRCAHCHEQGSIINVGDPPKWLEVEDTREDAWKTIQNLEELGSLNAAEPLMSDFLLKPLAEEVGGVNHRGGDKLLSLDDPSYLDFRRWIEHYAYCGGVFTE